jgi:hypothetical protein
VRVPDPKQCHDHDRQKRNTSQAGVTRVLRQHLAAHCNPFPVAELIPPVHLRRRHIRRQTKKRRGFLQDFACLPIAASFVRKTTAVKRQIGSIRKPICGADATTDRFGDAIRIAESDENVRCRGCELVETFCIMEPVDRNLPFGQPTDIDVHGVPAGEFNARLQATLRRSAA